MVSSIIESISAASKRIPRCNERSHSLVTSRCVNSFRTASATSHHHTHRLGHADGTAYPHAPYLVRLNEDEKGVSYLRCLWASGRGNEAAKATGHPASLQVKEQLLIDESLDFLGRRVFSAEAVAALRQEIEQSEEQTPENYEARASELQDEIGAIEKLIDRQVLVFEKYDDPNHPVVLAAERRVGELTRRQRDLAASVEALKEKHAGQTAKPAPRLADILEALPDLGPALASYDDDELIELFDAFNLEARYNHTEKTLASASLSSPNWLQFSKASDGPKGPVAATHL